LRDVKSFCTIVYTRKKAGTHGEGLVRVLASMVSFGELEAALKLEKFFAGDFSAGCKLLGVVRFGIIVQLAGD
jgi:hypothetical protein